MQKEEFVDKKFSSRTPWREKMKRPAEPRLVDIPARMQRRFGPGKMLIPTPMLVDALVRRIPKGRLATVNMLRERLAEESGAHTTCPLTTGIFLRIVAEAAEEAAHEGAKRITPYWRVLKSNGELNPKFPGGAAAQAARLKAEGHGIEHSKTKKPPKVKDFQKRLARL